MSLLGYLHNKNADHQCYSRRIHIPRIQAKIKYGKCMTGAGKCMAGANKCMTHVGKCMTCAGKSMTGAIAKCMTGVDMCIAGVGKCMASKYIESCDTTALLI